ncbi:MAG: ABC transporter permease [Thermoprotei archaeon]
MVDAVSSVALYEVRRSVARRKVIVLVAFTILIDTLPYVALASTGSSIIPVADYPYLWVAGVFAPQSLFIPFISILIAGGTMSEEYEQGTAELFLSKPITRLQYYAGKFLGGYAFLVFIVVLNDVLATLTASATFGPQAGVTALPEILVVQFYSSVLFYTVAFTVGELLRRSSLAYIFSSAMFFTSTILGVYLALILGITDNRLYAAILRLLPTTATSSLPSLLAGRLLPSAASFILGLVSAFPSSGGGFDFYLELIAVYTATALAAGVIHFVVADVTKRSG